MNGLEALHLAVREYEIHWRNPKLVPFEIYAPTYDIERDFDQQYPFAERFGCYVFFDVNFKTCYVGKASGPVNRLGHRIASYFRQPERHKPLTVIHQWHSNPRYIVSVAVHEAFEAPSLEEFLILKLKPSDNVRGRHRKA